MHIFVVLFKFDIVTTELCELLAGELMLLNGAECM